MRSKGIAAFVLAALFSGTLARAAAAWAGWTRHAVTGCSTYASDVVVADRVYNYSRDTFYEVRCEVPDSSDRPAHRTTGVNVFVYDGSTKDSVRLTICSLAFDSLTFACREEANSGQPSDVKHTVLFAPAALWAEHTPDFKFLSVQLPPIDAARISTLHGFTTF
jgi:hypothetical protein